MITDPGRALPERTILTMLQIGVQAVTDDLGASAPGSTVLDDILAQLDDDERAKARTYFTDLPPKVVMGYPRSTPTFPTYALTLGEDVTDHEYIGQGEHALLDDDDVKIGREYNSWVRGHFVIYVFAEHPDICAWYYRVLRRICRVGMLYLIRRGLDDPGISGSDLEPDPQFNVDTMFRRQVTLEVHYDESWSDTDALWVALNGPLAEDFITSGDQVDVRLEDLGGKVRPRVNLTTMDP